jgi:Bacterial capsule synthesis protein PGA_cap
MQLICLGDIAVCEMLDDPTPWLRPVPTLAEQNQTCILFNWELPRGESCVSIPRRSGGRRFVAPSGAVELLQNWAPAVAALANNHLMDAGAAGVARTIADLQRVGISVVGGGISAGRASEPWIWETDEGPVGVLNWVTPETNPDPPDSSGVGPNLWPGAEAARAQLASLRRHVAWVVIYVHWSDELFGYPRPADRVMARQLIESGADVVVGHHPHVVRGIEDIWGKPVFYSLGNYFFSDIGSPAGGWLIRQVPRTREALVLVLNFRRGRHIGWKLHSYWQDTTTTRPDPLDRAAQRATQQSRPFVSANYDVWYERKRRRFIRWGYRWHFRLPVIGWRGAARWLLKAGRFPR